MPSSRYDVELTRLAEKDLESLAAMNALARAEAAKAIARLETEPQAGHTLSGQLKSCRALAFSVQGSGQYRAVYYVVDPARVCLVFIVGPHENIYRAAEKRVRAAQRRVKVLRQR